MTARAAWAWCAAAGAAAFACSWAFGRIPGMVACGPTGGMGPIIAFELVRSPADVAALFGGEPCRSTLAVAQRTGLLLDGLGFIPFYTAFLILASVAVGVRGWIKATMIAIFAVAGLCDEIEGWLLGRILDALPGTPSLTDALFWAVHIKFALLGLGTLAIGALLLATRRLPAILPAVAIGAGALIALNAFLHLPDPKMMTGFAIAWIALLLTAITGAIWPSAFSPQSSSGARAAPPPSQATPTA